MIESEYVVKDDLGHTLDQIREDIQEWRYYNERTWAVRDLLLHGAQALIDVKGCDVFLRAIEEISLKGENGFYALLRAVCPTRAARKDLYLKMLEANQVKRHQDNHLVVTINHKDDAGGSYRIGEYDECDLSPNNVRIIEAAIRTYQLKEAILGRILDIPLRLANIIDPVNAPHEAGAPIEAFLLFKADPMALNEFKESLLAHGDSIPRSLIERVDFSEEKVNAIRSKLTMLSAELSAKSDLDDEQKEILENAQRLLSNSEFW